MQQLIPCIAVGGHPWSSARPPGGSSIPFEFIRSSRLLSIAPQRVHQAEPYGGGRDSANSSDMTRKKMHVITSNIEEGFTNSDVDDGDNGEGVNGGIKDRKKRKLKDIWNLPRGKRIVVKCNDLDQPIGKEAKHLGNFLGTIARNGSLCSLSYKDWRLLIGETDIETNERVNLKAILDQVKMRFLYPARLEPYILKTIRDRWRQHKSDLKAQHFHEKKKKKYPHRVVLFIHTHKPITKNNKNINAHVEELKGILKNQPELADNNQGKTAWKGDAPNRVLGDEKSGHTSSDPAPTLGDDAPSSDPAPTHGDDALVDGHYMKSKIKQSGSHGLDSQPSNKRDATDKNKESFVPNGNAQQGEKNAVAHNNKEIFSQHNYKQRLTRVSTSNKHDVLNKKNSKGANASMLSNKQQSGSLGCLGAGSWMGGGSLAVGTNVFLKSLSSGNKDVAIAIIING
uniref:Uncharacterized protein n=1 Tax=Avena sativa TaxID=4498 RepID=A0ACD5XJR9_AVESA